jgi:hypothetical protein
MTLAFVRIHVISQIEDDDKRQEVLDVINNHILAMWGARVS